jgi:hypothetical protein
MHDICLLLPFVRWVISPNEQHKRQSAGTADMIPGQRSLKISKIPVVAVVGDKGRRDVASPKNAIR